MPDEIGIAAIHRALSSTVDRGLLDLSFFGGEPLLEAAQILDWMDYARTVATDCGKRVRFSLTTNGTIGTREAWRLMRSGDLQLAISHDGSPRVHDRHRLGATGGKTSHVVEATIRSLILDGIIPSINTVIRPDTLDALPQSLAHLRALGIAQVNLSLDLWTCWSASDLDELDRRVAEAAELWLRWLPELSINWFDLKAGELAELKFTEPTVRCGFGSGEIAIAPSGNLYPCERVIGEDQPANPLRLPGHALEGADFLNQSSSPFMRCKPCSGCALNGLCDTVCPCSNFIRTGDVNQPDGLLCRLNKSTTRATASALARLGVQTSERKECYVT